MANWCRPGRPRARLGDDVGVSLADVTALRVLDPRVPFTVHSAEGEMVDVHAAGQRRPGRLRPADPDLAGLVILDFGAFDAWYEEDEQNVGHPRDPFHRIDVLASSRQVRLELDGQAAGGQLPAGPAVRDHAADPLLPPPG